MSENDQNSLLFEAKNLCFAPDGNKIIDAVSFQMKKGEAIAIVGASGSGKTTLGKLISGQLNPSSGNIDSPETKRILMVDQQDNFVSLSGQRSTYYGQRYENQGMDETPTVLEYLQKVAKLIKLSSIDENIAEVIETLHINRFKDRKLLQLSNGERKRTQLGAALLQKPDILVLDQPFVGLDSQSRERLNELLQGLKEDGTDLVVICSAKSIPSCVDQIIELSKGKINQYSSFKEFKPKATILPGQNENNEELLHTLPLSQNDFNTIIRMRKVKVVFGDDEVLSNIDWEVQKGERWALRGPNGAGKSTLLSLVTADNPQGYTNDLVLFDCQRGSGESIWTIKKRIGYVSPELHQYFVRGDGIYNTIPGLNSFSHSKYDSLTCIDVILSGFNDEIGFSSSSTNQQQEIAHTWLDILGLSHLNKSYFLQASLGEQRLLLLARALVKSPDLLILDEPCQGLDESQTNWFVQLLDSICSHLNLTMIYVSHYINEIPLCVNHLLELEDGKINYCGEFNPKVEK